MSKLRVITFNLARKVQENVSAGSERPLVIACQRKYPETKGWARSSPLSQCTLNATEWLVKQKADLIGIQESVPSSLIEMLKLMDGYTSIGYGPVQFIFNPESLGEGHILSLPNLYMREPLRQIIVVWFPKVQLLAINLHAPHRVNLEKEILGALAKVNLTGINPKRIIMTGDFNDGYFTPLTQLTVMGRVLRQHQTPPPFRSCCADSNYRTVGDYIFDSEYQRPGFYGIPPDVYDNLMSDHYPVVYYET